MTNFADQVLVRYAQDDENDYILNRWADGAHKQLCYEYSQTKFAKPLPRELWRALFPESQRRILKRSSVIVACAPQDPEVITGFVVCEPKSTPKVIHWVYVKQAFRRAGIAAKLLRYANVHLDDRAVYTSPSVIVKHLKARSWFYVPHWLLA